MDWLSDLVERFVVDVDDRALATARLVVVRQPPSIASMTAFLELCRLIGESSADPQAIGDALAARGSSDLLTRLGGLVVLCFATVRAEYPARPDAQIARTRLAAMADEVTDDAGVAFGAKVHQWLIRLCGEAIVQVSSIAATRAPLVRVETGISLPSTLLAYDLYNDPSRAGEMVERARTGTPLVMPITFEALAP